MAEFRRGTTPTLWFITDDLSWDEYDTWLTLEEGDLEMTFKDDRLTIDGVNVLVTLTQEETLQFSKKAAAQIKGKNGDTVVATTTQNIKVQPILNEEVM